MRKSLAILMLVFSLAACTPKEFKAYIDSFHDDSFLTCTRAHESDTAGGYRAISPDGRYFGAYQFLQSTWNNTALHVGLPQYVGAKIVDTPAPVQDYMAYGLYQWQGKYPWGNRC